MTTDPQTEYTAEIAERTVCVTWPDNERGGATPPPDGWQDDAFGSQSTLHEIDEGSITGCSVLRWRDDPRPDAELVAVSLALVTGKPAPAAAVPVAAPPTTEQTAWWREAADECDRAGAAYTSRAQNEHAAAAFTLMETFLRKANEVEYVAAPCDFVACEPGGEPCSTHERLMAHAEGDHELCAPDCGSEWQRRLADEAEPDGGPTWSDICPRCNRWYTTSEPGAHEKACQKPPTVDPRQAGGPSREATEPQHETQSDDVSGPDRLPLMAEELCPGFPDRCPNLRTVEPEQGVHLGGVRCGCADAPAVSSRPGTEQEA